MEGTKNITTETQTETRSRREMNKRQIDRESRETKEDNEDSDGDVFMEGNE